MPGIREIIVSVAASLVFGAAAGWGAATLQLKDDIHRVSERVTTLESERSLVWDPAAKRSDTNEESIKYLKQTVEELTSQNEAYEVLREQLSWFREESREKLAEEIRKIVRRDK